MSRYNVKVKFYDSGEIQIHTFPNGIDFDRDTLLSDSLDIYSDSSGAPAPDSSGAPAPDSSGAPAPDSSGAPAPYSDYFNLMRSVRRSRQTLFDFALNNTWDYFVTFTFDSDSKFYDRYSLDSCLKYIRQKLDHFKQDSVPDLKYLGVHEYHKDGAIHFHLLMSGSGLSDHLLFSDIQDQPYDVFYWPRWPCRNEWCVVQDSIALACYMCKYITKDLILERGRSRYLRSRNLKKPEERTFFLDSDQIGDQDLASYIAEHYFPEYQVTNVSNGRANSTYMRLK